MRSASLIVTGLGNVGRNFLKILTTQGELLRTEHGLELRVVGATDSAGSASDPNGLDLEAVVALKNEGRSVRQLPRTGKAGVGGLDLVRSLDADIVLEATPVNLTHGQPGLDIVRAALGRGMGCVLANKGPLALAFQELARASDWDDAAKPALRFSACVGGALPTINLGRRDLAGVRILKVEAILNGTSQGILRLMESGQTFEAALAEMQGRGVAETDPSLDVDGWDQAVKLVILANAVLRRPTVIGDLSVKGIRDVSVEDLHAATDRGERIVLLGTATRDRPDADWQLGVAPTSLPVDHPLARMSGDEMGIVYHTDIAGRLHATSEEPDAVPTAAAMLRDVIDIVC